MDNSITAKIVTEVKERQDGFIFSTIYPFCESVTEMRISKKDLTDALMLWKNLVRCKDCIFHQSCIHEQHLGLNGFCSYGERGCGR